MLKSKSFKFLSKLYIYRALTQTESKKKKLRESVKNLQNDLQQYKISNSEFLSEIT